MQWDQTRSYISPHSLRIWAYQPSDIHTLNWIRAKVREGGLIFHIPRKSDTLVQRGLSIVYSLFLNLTIPPFSFFCPKAGGLWYYWRDSPLPFPQFDVWSSFRICFNSIFVTSITWRLSMIYCYVHQKRYSNGIFKDDDDANQKPSLPPNAVKVHDDIGTIFWCMIRTC